jgi:hypothetical protein
MMVVGAIALLLLTAAIVVLYAMMGELAARVPDPDGNSANHVTPLADFTRGAAPTIYPTGLASLAHQARMALMVLSPICTTCDKVAAELANYDPDEIGLPFGVVVSTSTRETGEEFVERHTLHRFPYVVDEGATWITGSLGVKMSPSALVFENGVLTEAFTFSNVQAILGRIVKVRQGVS